MKRTALVSGLAAACLALSAGARARQQDFSKVQMKATRAGGNVYMLEGAGGNIGVSVGVDGVLVVDDQFAPLAEKIRAAVKELNPGALRFILNTHFHGDHTGSNAILGRESTIIAHDNVRKRLASEQTVLGGKVPASPKRRCPSSPTRSRSRSTSTTRRFASSTSRTATPTATRSSSSRARTSSTWATTSSPGASPSST